MAPRNCSHRDSRCEQFLGAMMATGYAKVQHCTVDIDGYVSCFGYCHNGGLMGLFYTSGTKYPLGLENRVVNHNTVTGRIYFFEHNPDRRAYCKGDVGETLTKLTSRKPNNLKGFTRKETKEFRKVLRNRSTRKKRSLRLTANGVGQSTPAQPAATPGAITTSLRNNTGIWQPAAN